MALINCSECGRKISDKAVACPGCGTSPVSSAKEQVDDIIDVGFDEPPVDEPVNPRWEKTSPQEDRDRPSSDSSSGFRKDTKNPVEATVEPTQSDSPKKEHYQSSGKFKRDTQYTDHKTDNKQKKEKPRAENNSGSRNDTHSQESTSFSDSSAISFKWDPNIKTNDKSSSIKPKSTTTVVDPLHALKNIYYSDNSLAYNLVLIVAFLMALLAFINNFQENSYSHNDTSSSILSLNSEQNGSSMLPTMIDEDLQFSSESFYPKEVVNNFNLLYNADSKYYEGLIIIRYNKLFISKLCSPAWSTRKMLDDGFVFTNNFYDSKDRHIKTFKVSKSDCE